MANAFDIIDFSDYLDDFDPVVWDKVIQDDGETLTAAGPFGPPPDVRYGEANASGTDQAGYCSQHALGINMHQNDDIHVSITVHTGEAKFGAVYPQWRPILWMNPHNLGVETKSGANTIDRPNQLGVGPIHDWALGNIGYIQNLHDGPRGDLMAPEMYPTWNGTQDDPAGQANTGTAAGWPTWETSPAETEITATCQGGVWSATWNGNSHANWTDLERPSWARGATYFGFAVMAIYPDVLSVDPVLDPGLAGWLNDWQVSDLVITRL